MKLRGSHLLILLLAAVALIFGTGCAWDIWALATGYEPDPDYTEYIIIRCQQDTKTLQAYDVRDFRETEISSPINGAPCSVSTENQNRPFSISEAVEKHLVIPGKTSNRPAASTVPQSTRLNDKFPYIVPLLLDPVFPTTDVGKLAVNCDSGLGAYLVNHLQNTVTSFSVCPLQTLATINVAANPLQLALTPDGTTLLVTSYDSAVTFIDTSKDTVTATLNLPGYNPSGIAISPDGTRAYVTHYFDTNPALLVIDVQARRLVNTVPLPGAYPRTVAVTPDGAQAWVTYLNSTTVTIVDTLSGTVAKGIGLPGPLGMGIAFNPTGTKAFLAGSPANVFVVDTGSLAMIANITVGPSPTEVIADPNGRNVFVDSATMRGVWLIDAVNNTLAHAPTSPTPGPSMGLLIIH